MNSWGNFVAQYPSYFTGILDKTVAEALEDLDRFKAGFAVKVPQSRDQRDNLGSFARIPRA